MMNGVSHKTLTPALLIILAVILFLAINVIANTLLRGVRLDLTEDNLYTLSEGTKNTLRSLEEPVRMRFFFSEKLATPYPTIFSYGQRVQDILQEYAAIAGDNIRLEIINPEPFTDEEDEAVGLGLQGLPTQAGETIYLGLVVNDSTDREAVIPFFNNEREKFLEYDLTKTIYALAQGERPKVGLLSSLPMQFGPGGIMAFARGQGRPYVIYEQMQQFFELSTLDGSFTTIPDDIAVLLIAHPPELSEAQLFQIDQFVMKGGKALIFTDPYSEASAAAAAQAAASGAPSMAAESSDMNRLLAAWGVEMVPGMIVSDLELAQKVNMGGFGARAVRDYPLWMGITEDYIDPSDIVTGNLQNLNMATSGALRALTGATTTLIPLVTSSETSALVDASEGQGDPDPDRLIRNLIPDEERHILIARLTGEAPSAFPDGPPAAEGGETPAGAWLAKSEGPINLIIGADADLFDDRFWVQVQDFFGQRVVQPIADNGSFFINAIDNLAGSDDLIGLRSRGVSQRPFTVVEDIRKAADANFLAEEQRLQEKLQDAEARIAELESQSPSGSELLNPEQEAEIERFRADMLETRRELRTVQRNLRQDIESLGGWLAFINIALIPVLIVVGVLLFRGFSRRRAA